MSDLFSTLQYEENWRQFSLELLKTGRDGTDRLLDYLETKTDMKKAPASSKYHRNTYGGLVDHSLRVMKFLRHVNTEMGDIEKDENIVIAGLLHDLCKANYYVVEEKWRKDAKNKWESYMAYGVDEELPLGHGEKSIIIANRFIPLTKNEMMAIRWHMSAFDAGIHFNYPSGSPFRSSMDRCPLLKMLIIADQMAELEETLNPLKEVIQ